MVAASAMAGGGPAATVAWGHPVPARGSLRWIAGGSSPMPRWPPYWQNGHNATALDDTPVRAGVLAVRRVQPGRLPELPFMLLLQQQPSACLACSVHALRRSSCVVTRGCGRDLLSGWRIASGFAVSRWLSRGVLADIRNNTACLPPTPQILSQCSRGVGTVSLFSPIRIPPATLAQLSTSRVHCNILASLLCA